MKGHTYGAEEGTLLRQFSDALAAAVAAVSGSVVRVEGRRRRGASGIAWSEDLVVAAHHSVHRDQDLRVGLPDGTTVPAALVGRDPTTDVVLLRVEEGGLQPPGWVEADALRAGHFVLSIGRPGRDVQAGLGIVSVKKEGWRSPGGGRVETYLQTDVALYPGFSGSALVDAEGRVAGMNTSGLLRGLSLALSAATLRRVTAALTEYGRVRRGYLGVGAYPARLPEALSEQLGRAQGLLVLSIEPESPAGEAGLLVGDLLVALDEEPIEGVEGLLALLTGDRIGASASLQIVRGGHLQDLIVHLAERNGR